MLLESKEFYPTPVGLIEKMLEGINLSRISTILEPSAGKGDLIDFVLKKKSRWDAKIDIDAIEIEEYLTHILKGKGYRVIHDDFITLETYKSYNLILMNPPFSTGDKHLLKAINMQKDGGEIVCILNAETLKNPFSNTRKDLVRKLEEIEAEVEYLENEFVSAKRKTNVEIALIKIDIPYKNDKSIILDELRKEKIQYGYVENENEIVDGDWFKGIVEQYNYEVSAGVKLINEFYALKPKLLQEFEEKEKLGSCILSLNIYGSNNSLAKRHELINKFIKKVRYKYWRTFFQFKEIGSMLTSNLLDKYMDKLQELSEYDFTLYNIYTLRLQLHKEMAIGVEDCIIELFDYLSHEYSYNDEYSNNIHYYNGWKTNKAWYINKKVIVPLNGWDSWGQSYSFDPRYRVRDKLLDIEKALNYLAYGKTGNSTEAIDLRKRLEQASIDNQSKNIPLTYFRVTFYKKGTCHIKFTDLELLKKLNIFGSQQKKWLPPSYGKAKYEDMTEEEKEVINQFEGKEEYEKVMENTEYFIYNSSDILKLQG